MALSKHEIEQLDDALIKMQLPKGASRFFESSFSSVMNKLKDEIIKGDNREKRGDQYAELIIEFELAKKKFEDAAKSIREGGFKEKKDAAKSIKEGGFKEKKEEFEKSTMQYYAALKVFSECHLGIHNQSISMVNLEKEHKTLAGNITSYKNTLEEVALAIADHQLRDIEEGEEVRLEEVIPHVKKVYEQAYHDEHKSFWRWIKINVLRQSDRVQEIDFLNSISQHPDCNEFIRLQAARLVHDKIIATERFGKNSKLAQQLGEVTEKGHVSFDENSPTKLVTFLYDNHLDDKIPDSLKEYLKQNREKYDIAPNEYITHTSLV
ncbi:hypothetical protein [Legionella sp. WA2022007384]